MATTSEHLEIIGNNVAAIAAESASILENGRQVIVKETQTVVKEQIAPISSLSDNDYITIGKNLHKNVGEHFNYTDYIYNVTDVSTLPEINANTLPVVYLNGDVSGMVTKDDKVNLDYRIGRFNGQFLEGTCQCKYQGNSTWNTPKHNYSLSKMSNSIDLGWGAQKKYVLKGEYRESSYARNVVCARLWADVVKSRTDTNDLLTRIKSTPNCCAVDGFPVMLVLNGSYRGVFTLNIPKDKWMMGMGDGEREALLQTDAGNVNIQSWNAPLTKEVLLTDDLSMTIEYVTDEEDVDWVVDSWNNIYNIITNNQNNSGYIDVLSPYIDITNVIDYYIYSTLIGNWDGFRHNFLFSTFDGTKWFYTAYDLNFTFGAAGNMFYNPKACPPISFLVYANSDKLMKLIHTHSKSLIKSRYEVLRNNPLSEYNVLTRFSNFMKRIPERLKQVEYELYPYEATFGEHLAQISSWYRLRCEYLDAEVESWNV